jgi:hypothetical protein
MLFERERERERERPPGATSYENKFSDILYKRGWVKTGCNNVF